MITVRAHKYDGSEHRRWTARVLKQEGALLVLEARFEEEIQHALLGTISAGTLSIEYYWLDRWYNVFRFVELDGQLRNYYCNINVPPTLEGDDLSYVDLDIDILVQPDLSYEILDLDEFELNARQFGYSTEVVAQAHRAVNDLEDLIQSGSFPFSQHDNT